MDPLLLDTTICVEGVSVRVSASRWQELPGGEALYHFEFNSTADLNTPRV